MAPIVIAAAVPRTAVASPVLATRAGPLRGPKYVVPGQRVRFRLVRSAKPVQLCYQAGAGRKTCYRTATSWYVVIRPSSVQYFTVRSKGLVVGRLIYVNGTLRTKI